MAITAADVNKLRQQTGAGMMDCKNALVEADGDFDKAVDILRKKGQKVAAKRSDRDAAEGLVIGKTTADNKRGVLIVLNCETDFVAKNEDFVAFANKIVDLAIEKNPADLNALLALNFDGKTVAEKITEEVGKIGEKIELSAYETVEAAHVVAYNHPGNKIASIVGLNKDGFAEVAKEMAMQVAAMNPVAVDKDDVPQSVVEKELEIGREVAAQEGKPAEMLDKIAQGKLNRFFKESTLLNQDFIREHKKSIRQYLQEKDKELTVTEFKRISLAN